MPGRIRTVEEFYAHALAIEREAAERYLEFRDHFEASGEDVLAGLCANLAHFEQAHYEELQGQARQMSVPVVESGGYHWLENESPEALARDFVYRVAAPRQLLELALAAERRARDFFRDVAETSPAETVRALAAEMAREEEEHVRWVTLALEYLPEEPADWNRLLENGALPSLLLGAERRSGGSRT